MMYAEGFVRAKNEASSACFVDAFRDGRTLAEAVIIVSV